ncbi:FRIGIDA-like protein 1 [Cajanus cajan]|uniref:FRIGIDA-like protein 1 n=1 Tax=Cajanus cajan TaxID=3821 RepID=UPI00098D9913|nr:FRIGIDA-like protein 1 [Cajanus cajan]
MSALKTISEALNLVDSKKENLKKAYDDLQSLLNPLPLSWPDLDSHFTSLHHSLSHRFHLLQSQSQSQTLTLTPISDPPPQTPQNATFSSNPADPSPNRDNSSPGVSPQNDAVPGPVAPREELIHLCEKMDGVGLRNYLNDHFEDRDRVQAELPGAFRHAPDAGVVVLGALEGFHGEECGELKDWELRNMRRTCIVLMKQFRASGVSVSGEASVRARGLALEWKERVVGDDDPGALGALGFLHLVYAFGLVSEFSLDGLVDISVMGPANAEFLEMCRAVGLTERVPDIVQKLIANDKHMAAVKYIFEFNLADRIPPVPILKACVEHSKELATRLSKEPKSAIESTNKEINTLRSVIKIIENHELESEYPRASLEQRIKQLKRQKTDIMRPVLASAAKNSQRKQQQQQQQQPQRRNKQKPKQTGIKRPWTSAPVGPAPVLKNINNVNSTMHHYQQPPAHPSGLFPEHPNPYMSTPAMPYGMLAPSPNVPPYAVRSAGPYGHDGLPMGPSGNPSLGGAHLSSSEAHVPTGYYDRASNYGGIDPQHYYQTSYYPQ